jgi:hypothetical protein
MTTLFYGINVGSEYETVSISATTTGKDIEVAVNNLTAVDGRDALVVHLAKLLDAIERANWRPI